MNRIKKLFTNYDLTWKKVIIFAVTIAIFTGLLNSVPFLIDTSFTDIAVNFEWWIIFAIFIIINTKSLKEACLKCFVFFLISQPIIYLVEVPFALEGFLIFRHYKAWFIWTLLTIPGSIIAYQLKRKDWLSLAVLAVVIVYYGYIAAAYTNSFIYNFPRHILSALIALAMALFLIDVLFDLKIHKIILIALLILSFIISFISFRKDVNKEIVLDSNDYVVEIENDDVIKIKIENGILTISPIKDGYSYLNLTDSNGKELVYYVTVSGGSVWIDLLD